MDVRLWGHSESLSETRVSRKGLNPASTRRVIVVDELVMLMWPSNARAVLGIALQSADDVRSGTNPNIRTSSAGYDLFPCHPGRQMPAAFLRVSFNAPLKPVIIPTQHQKNSALFSFHLACSSRSHRRCRLAPRSFVCQPLSKEIILSLCWDEAGGPAPR